MITWLQVLVVSHCLQRQMNTLTLHVHKCCSHQGMTSCSRYADCNNHQYSVSGLSVSPGKRQPLKPCSVTNHLHIYQDMYSHSFVFISKLLCDLQSLIWALLQENHFTQLFCTHFRIQIQRSDWGLQYTVTIIL